MTTIQVEPPSKEKANFFRLVTLLLDCGTDVLRKVLVTNQAFTQFSNLTDFLKNYRKEIKKLCRKKVLREEQYYQLFPPNNSSADIKSFDITLLSCLILNTCTLTLKQKAHIETLKTLRNDVSGHSPNAAKADAEYNSYFGAIVAVITDLAQLTKDAEFEKFVQNSITKIQKSIYSPEEYLLQAITVDSERQLQQNHHLYTTEMKSAIESALDPRVQTLIGRRRPKLA